MANTILYSEINAVCILILLLLCVKVKNSMFLQEQRYLFLKVAVPLTYVNKQFLPERAIYAVRSVFEKMVAVNIIPKLEERFHLRFEVVFAEKDQRLEMNCTYQGKEFNPFDVGEAVSMSIVKHAEASWTFAYQENVNQVHIKCRELQ